jgi:hypothetical protein
MNDSALANQTDAWSNELWRTETECATFFARRVPHWIATGNRIWGIFVQPDAPRSERTLQEDLMYCAKVEVALRGEFTRLAFGRLAQRAAAVSASRVLVDCTKLAGELLPRICRDVEKDIQHASHFLYGVDGGCVAAAVSAEMQKLADHVLDVVTDRSDFTI